MEEQQFNLREGAEIIIATPGRLKDVIDRHVLVLSQCTYVVMDEADRMVNLGFEADLNFILDALPSDSLRDADGMEIDQVMTDGVQSKGKTRVTTLFSATMPPAVERLAKKYLRKPAVITIGEAGRAVDRVEQRVEFVQGEDKRKCVPKNLRLYAGCWIDLPLQGSYSRYPQQWRLRTTNYRVRQSKEDRRHGCQRPLSCWGR